MDPITYTVSSTIAATVERVFQVLTDPHRIAQWLPAARAVEAVAPLFKGARMRVVFDTRAAEVEVVDFNPPDTFGWVELVGRKHWKTFFRLEFDGASTRLTIQQIWLPPSFLAWLKVKLRPNRNVPARLHAIIQNLRTAVAR